MPRTIANALFVVAILVAAMACNQAARRPNPQPTQTSPALLGPATRGSALQLPIDVRVAVRDPAYLPGQTITFEVTIINKSAEALAIQPFAPEIDILDRGAGKTVRSFPAGASAVTLAPGESRGSELSWDQRDETGNQVGPGYYLVSINKIAAGAGSMGPMTSANSVAMDKILIENPQGNLERSVTVGQTLDVSGVRVVLDRVDFTRAGTKVYARAIPLGYDFPGGVRRPAMPPMSIMPFEPDAQYQVDRGPLLEAGGGSFNPNVSDVEISWDINPLPVDATSFVFSVRSLGRWVGPWRFVIDLSSH